MQTATVGEAQTWATDRPDELSPAMAALGLLRLWRCATASEPYFGPGSFWTPSRAYAGWFARWKAATYPEHRSLAVYRAELRVADAAVLDLRRHLGRWIEPAATGAAVLAKADRLAARGVEWVLTTGDDPLGDEGAWTEAIYIGSGSVAAVRATPA